MAAGDRIVSINGNSLSDKTNLEVTRLLRTSDLITLVVDRSRRGSLSGSEFEDITVQIVKKPGKGLGLSVVGRRHGPGVFVSDMVRSKRKL